MLVEEVSLTGSGSGGGVTEEEVLEMRRREGRGSVFLPDGPVWANDWDGVLCFVTLEFSIVLDFACIFGFGCGDLVETCGRGTCACTPRP
jgi:hypothetical protein